MARRRPRDPSKPTPSWNAPIGIRAWKLKKGQRWKPRQLATVPKRERGKLRGRLKRRFGLNRRQVGAIGAGHIEAPDGYRVALLGELERTRFRLGVRS